MQWAEFFAAALEASNVRVAQGGPLLAREAPWTLDELKKHFRGKKGASFHAIPASIPINEQVDLLQKLLERGVVTKSPEPDLAIFQQSGDGKRLVAWSTDNILLSEARSVMCFDALLQAACALSIEVSLAPRTP